MPLTTNNNGLSIFRRPTLNSLKVHRSLNKVGLMDALDQHRTWFFVPLVSSCR